MHCSKSCMAIIILIVATGHEDILGDFSPATLARARMVVARPRHLLVVALGVIGRVVVAARELGVALLLGDEGLPVGALLIDRILLIGQLLLASDRLYLFLLALDHLRRVVRLDLQACGDCQGALLGRAGVGGARLEGLRPARPCATRCPRLGGGVALEDHALGLEVLHALKASVDDGDGPIGVDLLHDRLVEGPVASVPRGNGLACRERGHVRHRVLLDRGLGHQL
mmetsp:Transcript_30544/g.69975  ORF Transcript_30544/g.69975 Transcript_30544/m.69975 type:complete len:227 (-) Transcript_30544:347-1027(-)